MDRRQFLISTAATSTILATGWGTSRANAALPDYYPPDYATLVEAAKSEGRVLAYTNMSIDSWTNFLAPFNEMFPEITVEPVELGSSEPMERYLAEKGSGVATCDMIFTTAPEAWMDMVQRGEIVDYQSPESSQYPDVARPFPGVYTLTIDPVIFMWNKLLLPEDMVPRSMAELYEKAKANPDIFQGKISTQAPFLEAYGYSIYYTLLKKHGDMLWQWLDVLGPMTVSERSVSPLLEKLVTGEYVLGYNMGAAPVMRGLDETRASLLDWSFITDGTVMHPRGAAVMAGGANQNAARVLLDYFLSHQGQIALSAGGRVPSRPDVTRDDVKGSYTYSAVVEAIGQDNVLVVPYETEMSDRYDELVERFRAAFERS